jgi:ATP-dependent 26S proteasome regulatory subunit
MRVGKLLLNQHCENLMEIKNENLADCFAAVYRKTVSGGLHKESKSLDAEIEAWAQNLNMTRDELIVFALIFHHQFRIAPINEDRLYELAERQMGNRGDAYDILNSFRKLRVVGETDNPMESKIILQRSVWAAARKGDMQFLREIKPVGLQRFAEYFRYTLLDHDFLTDRELTEEMEFLMAVNPELTLVKHIRRLPLSQMFLMCSIAVRFITENKPFEMRYIERFVRSSSGFALLKQVVTSNQWAPIKAKLVQHAGGSLLSDDIELELTNKGIEVLLPEMADTLQANMKEKMKELPPYAICHSKIKEASLLFEPGVQQQVNDLQRLLRPAMFKQFKRKLPPQGRMSGLTVLFYGAPGTGKTELALQLARTTGRPVFRLDVTHIMSKWVGESEKNLKSFFYDYRKAIEYRHPEPILLLNECDGLITRRMAVNSSVDQMTNALQNILLEEMENFSGIMIATTNMTRNLDDAFERRFLFKVCFELPEHDVALKIWQQAIPDLSREQASNIAARYRYSAAEIYNIARKLAVQALLRQKVPLHELVLQLCTEEKWTKQATHSMGFS